MSYVIPTSELTKGAIREFKSKAIEAGIAAAVRAGFGARNQLVVRHAFPRTDFGSPTTGYTNEIYIGGVIALAAINAWGSPFSTVGVLPGVCPQLANNKVAVFYKVADTEGAPAITAVRFRQGATAASTLATFFLQQPQDAKLEPDVYFSEPVVYNPQDWVFIEVYYVAAVAVGEHIPFEAFIIERLGGNVS